MASPLELAVSTHEAVEGPAGARPGLFSTGSVVSSDGTAIGYRQVGHGPGIVVVHGAVESAQSHMQLADALADSFTVHLIDRRGRGLSGSCGADQSIQRDVDDVAAIMARTGSRNLFGVSSGGAIALQAAVSLPAIQKVAVYDPALIDDPSTLEAQLARFDREIAEGRVASALVIAMKASEMGPRIFNLIPRPILAWLTGSMLRREDRSAPPDAPTMRTLAPTIHHDFRAIIDASSRIDDFRAIRGQVLLLGGAKSPAYLRHALDRLEGILPGSRRVTFATLGHGGSGNSDWGGSPDIVAQELRAFFS